MFGRSLSIEDLDAIVRRVQTRAVAWLRRCGNVEERELDLVELWRLVRLVERGVPTRLEP